MLYRGRALGEETTWMEMLIFVKIGEDFVRRGEVNVLFQAYQGMHFLRTMHQMHLLAHGERNFRRFAHELYVC